MFIYCFSWNFHELKWKQLRFYVSLCMCVYVWWRICLCIYELLHTTDLWAGTLIVTLPETLDVLWWLSAGVSKRFSVSHQILTTSASALCGVCPNYSVLSHTTKAAEDYIKEKVCSNKTLWTLTIELHRIFIKCTLSLVCPPNSLKNAKTPLAREHIKIRAMPDLIHKPWSADLGFKGLAQLLNTISLELSSPMA